MKWSGFLWLTSVGFHDEYQFGWLNDTINIFHCSADAISCIYVLFYKVSWSLCILVLCFSFPPSILKYKSPTSRQGNRIPFAYKKKVFFWSSDCPPYVRKKFIYYVQETILGGCQPPAYRHLRTSYWTSLNMSGKSLCSEVQPEQIWTCPRGECCNISYFQ